MAATELLSNFIISIQGNFSKSERLLLEGILFVLVYEELKNYFRKKYKKYFYLINYTLMEEEQMLENNLIKLLLNDIIASGEYTLSGIACYTNTPEDMLHDLLLGNYISPSANLLRKAVELHQSIRPELYKTIEDKITKNYHDKKQI